MQISKHASRITAYNQNTKCAVTHINYNITKGLRYPMTADIDLWVTATILRELRDNGLITQKKAEKILSRVAKQTGATLIISV